MRPDQRAAFGLDFWRAISEVCGKHGATGVMMTDMSKPNRPDQAILEVSITFTDGRPPDVEQAMDKIYERLADSGD
jgi:hypothetical protein